MRDKTLRDTRDEQQELEALHRLDEECVHQQRAGDYLKAFDCMERALVLRRHFFGVESEEVIQSCRALAEMCNLLAMSFLQQDNYTITIDLLKKAEVLTQRHHPVERATTLNNLACYYRRLGKPHSAMTSLKRAFELEKRLANVRNAADTQLNMCAVLSQLGKHQEALERAQEALITLQEGFIHNKHTTDSTTGEVSSSRLDRISVMCIAYHNVGVEQEFLKDYTESVASYKKGIGLAEQYLGSDHSITTTIRNSYLAAKRTLATKARVKSCSASRDRKSPSKTGSRLLSSPLSEALRMPSSLVKGKDRHNSPQFPTPRSIIADALSRAPLSALPPLEIQSPSISDKKKTNAPSAASLLSPTDPFFSPRFHFDSNSIEGKPKRLASITSPHSTTAVNAQVKTPLSSKGKRERRKSSVKKPSTAAESDKRATISSHKERRKTAAAPRSSEENRHTGVDASQDVNGMTIAKEAASGESLTTESVVVTKEHEMSSRFDLDNKVNGDGYAQNESGFNKETKLDVSAEDTSNNEAIQLLDDNLAGTISTLLTSIVEMVARQETTCDITDENNCITVKDPPEEVSVEIAVDDHPATFFTGERIVELNEASQDAPVESIVEAEQEKNTSSLIGINIPDEYITEDTADAFISSGYNRNVAEVAEDTTEEVYSEMALIANKTIETRLILSEDAAATEMLDSNNLVDEDKGIDQSIELPTQNEVEIEEVPQTEVEDSAETALVDEELEQPVASTEEISNGHYNEEYLLEAPENNESTLLNVVDNEQMILNSGEPDADHQKYFSHDAEDFASALFQYETQEDFPVENGEVYQDIYPATEYKTFDIETNENAYEEMYQDEVDTENGALEPAFYDESEHVDLNYEGKELEDVTRKQDCNYVQAAMETAIEYGENTLDLLHSSEEE